MLLASRQAPTVFLVLLLASLCWAILAWLVIDMCHPIAMMTMPMSPAWSTSNFIAVFLMWAIMMAAMMLPSALPMIIIHRKMSSTSTNGVTTAIFTAAYLIIWSVFSIFAVTTQFFAHGLGVLNPSDLTLSTLLSAIVLIAAGGFQFTKLKDTCLKACQSPAGFFMTRWEGGSIGALKMGLSHGLFCLGCCWALMLLLFVGGVMNLAWVLLLTFGVLAEKTIPAGKALSNLIGIALIIFGAFLFYRYFWSTPMMPMSDMAMDCMKMGNMDMKNMDMNK